MTTEERPDRDGDVVSDPERVLALLWRDLPARRRGPRPKVTLEQVVDAGLDIAREQGLAGLSMRTVAARLGVGAMSLYTHVPGKAELVELMVEATFAARTPVDVDAPWQQRVRQHVHETRRCYERDPWLLDTNLSRPPLGPATMAASERLLQALLDAGLTPADVVSTSELVEGFVQGTAGARIRDAEQTRLTGLSSDDYWGDRQVFWERYFDFAAHPAHVRLWEAGAFDRDDPDAFDRQLDSVVEGIERLGTR